MNELEENFSVFQSLERSLLNSTSIENSLSTIGILSEKRLAIRYEYQMTKLFNSNFQWVTTDWAVALILLIRIVHRSELFVHWIFIQKSSFDSLKENEQKHIFSLKNSSWNFSEFLWIERKWFVRISCHYSIRIVLKRKFLKKRIFSSEKSNSDGFELIDEVCIVVHFNIVSQFMTHQEKIRINESMNLVDQRQSSWWFVQVRLNMFGKYLFIISKIKK